MPPRTDLLLAHLGPQVAVLVLSCAPLPPRVPRASVLAHDLGCVARFGDHVVPEALAQGVGEVHIDPGCEHDATALDEKVARWRQLCGGRVEWLLAQRVWLSARPLDLSDRAAQRRRLLAGATSPEPRSEDRRLRDALAAIGAASASAGLDRVDSTAIRVQAEGCLACGVCVQSCPHQALSLRGEGCTVLGHRPDLCEGCAECVRHCPEQALSVTGRWSLAQALVEQEVVVAQVVTRRCSSCHARHGTAGRWCPTCTYRRERGFGEAMSVDEVLRLRRPPGPGSAGELG